MRPWRQCSQKLASQYLDWFVVYSMTLFQLYCIYSSIIWRIWKDTERSVRGLSQSNTYYHKACLENLKKSTKALSSTSRAWNLPDVTVESYRFVFGRSRLQISARRPAILTRVPWFSWVPLQQDSALNYAMTASSDMLFSSYSLIIPSVGAVLTASSNTTNI
jgi:hypothetical protein